VHMCLFMGCVDQEMPGSDHCVWILLGVLSAWVLPLGMVVCSMLCWCVFVVGFVCASRVADMCGGAYGHGRLSCVLGGCVCVVLW